MWKTIGCIANNIFQCPNGGGIPQNLGPCIKGCITTSTGQNDYCA